MSILLWFFSSRLGNAAGLALVAVLAVGGIYVKGRIDGRHDDQVKQIKNNKLATKQRDEIDRAVPRTDWPDRVDELR